MTILIALAIYLLVAALFWYAVDWLNCPQPFNKIIKAIIALCVLLHVYVVLVGGVVYGAPYYYL